jgi:hypothetical protein
MLRTAKQCNWYQVTFTTPYGILVVPPLSKVAPDSRLMAIDILETNRKIGLTDIGRFEAEIDANLPPEYRQFLLTFNGGKPEGNQFDVREAKTNAGVNLFFGLLNTQREGDLLYERARMLDRVPHNVLSIGNASCGNLVCLSLRTDTFGQIFFWEHEMEAEEGEPATFSNLFKVGNSFQQFFDGLKKFDPSQVELEPGQVKRVWIDPEFLKSLKKKADDSTK